MNCSEARPLLDLLCDGALEAKDSALVLDHLKSCSECQYEWNDLEQLHSSFQEAKQNTQLPAGLMDRISAKLDEEERSQHRQFFAQYTRALPIMVIAASVALIGFLVLPGIYQSNIRSSSMQTASADTLVDDLVSESTLDPVTDRTELARKLGYEVKYVRLPAWQMNKSGVYKSHASTPIARFDFVRKAESGYQHLSCYQAPQGVIRANTADAENIEGRRVLFGNHGKFQFALFSQNGRDYLFVTPLSKHNLEEIVRGA